VRAIGEAAGVLSGSLYHHFDSKEAMVDELLATYFEALLGRYNEIIEAGRPPLETFREMVYVAFDTIEQHRAATRTLQNEGRYFAALPRFAYLKDRERTIEELWIAIIKSGKASGAIRSNLDPRTVYRFARDGIWVAARWYKPTGKLTHRDLADQFLTILLAGIAAPTTE
jgi:AcrR family transcriptional regulator